MGNPMDSMPPGAGNPIGDVFEGGENPMEGLLEGDAGDILNNLGGDGLDINLGGKSLPKDFPSQVPLVKGDIVSAGSITADGETIWTVQMMVKDASVFDQVRAQMAQAGFEEDFVTDGEYRMGSFTGNGYGTLVTVSESNGQVSISYMVGSEDDD